jgi:hypothetical protein
MLILCFAMKKQNDGTVNPNKSVAYRIDIRHMNRSHSIRNVCSACLLWFYITSLQKKQPSKFDYKVDPQNPPSSTVPTGPIGPIGPT